MHRHPFRTLPAYVYKILADEPPTILPRDLPRTELDAQDGFIHLSDAGRVPHTADLYFGSARTIWLLKISVAKLQTESGELRFADPGCLHLHGEREGEFVRLGDGIVVGVKQCDRKEGATWAEALKDLSGKENWLID
ncbi:hypothetical protein BOTBODRAFT_562383 [Botryobasidium botryosum FD-172 SS1]|uniref:DUF952 domain-containing protein n=1 Tax=Botryobasidium botryosum (strain FD-172 SS1) TaxID=930990 RepID=A0A067M1M7_BOTB1|nr:hypothetical protein BOTBODRAFT_562383 [Botryobasidium botryosum FD-172 SS1]